MLKVISQGAGWRISFSSEGATAYPYRPETYFDDDGTQRVNHPCVDLVERYDLIDTLPEVREFPPLAQLLKVINRSGGVLRSTQSNPGFCQDDKGRECAGVNLHVAFRDDQRNTFVCQLAELAQDIAAQLPIIQAPVLFLLTIEPYKSWRGCAGYFGLALECRGYGRSRDEVMQNSQLAAEVLTRALRSYDR